MEEDLDNDIELQEDFLKGLEDMDWEEDWSDVEVLHGSESLCCLSFTSVAAAPLPTVPSVTELVEEPIVEAEEKPDASATDESASSSVSTSGVRRS